MSPQFPESKISEMVPTLFWEMWGRRISVRQDILQPTGQAMVSSYNDHQTGHRDDLAGIAKSPLENPPASPGLENKGAGNGPEAAPD
jgi:hypothetical protein